MVIEPAPYSPAGIVPSKAAYSIGWSSVCTARWLTPDVSGTPFGTAQLFSTPSFSSRRSKCRRLAWCSWITKRGAPPLGSPQLDSGIGSGVIELVRIERYAASGPPCDRAVSSRIGSPCSATRASTSCASRWRRPGSSSSSQVRGAATVGRSRPRSEYGAIVVFLPLFWLQSMSTRRVRSVLRMLLTISSGWSASSARASSCATPDTWSEVCVPSSAVYRWMPLLPLVTGTASSPIPEVRSRTSRATSAHSTRLMPSPGSRSNTMRSGLEGSPCASKRHCGTCNSSAACCASHTSVARSPAIGYDLSPSEWWMTPRRTHSGACSARFFSKKAGSGASAVPTPCTQRFRVTGRPATSGTMTAAISA